MRNRGRVRGQNPFRTILYNGRGGDDIPREFWRSRGYKSTKGGFDDGECCTVREWQLVWHDGGNLSLLSVIDSAAVSAASVV